MTRAISQLDPMPSTAELLRIQQERLARRPDLAHLRELAPVCGRSAPTNEVEKRATGRNPARVSTSAPRIPATSMPAIAERHGDTLRLVLHVPPRTKKNGGAGGFMGIKQRPAYRRFHARVLELLAPIVPALDLPLPDQPYNIAAVYYVDRPGEQADKVGLDQGLYDALQDAGVVSDDWYFRTADGSQVIAGDPAPRIELLISPLPPAA